MVSKPGLVGLAGALLTGIGDVLILGRPMSGADFDRAARVAPAFVGPRDPWRSLWNGAVLSRRRVRLGGAVGLVGIGLQGFALQSEAGLVHPELLQCAAAVSGSAFAVSGALTHQACAAVILAYQEALAAGITSWGEAEPSLRPLTNLLAVSAVASLGALAVFSAAVTYGARLRHDAGPSWQEVATPLPCVALALVAARVLPAPLGGYARPASMSIGLLTHFVVVAASGGPRLPCARGGAAP